jgi:hypothetical protein
MLTAIRPSRHIMRKIYVFSVRVINLLTKTKIRA